MSTHSHPEETCCASCAAGQEAKHSRRPSLMLIRVLSTAAALAALLLGGLDEGPLALPTFAALYLWIGYDILWQALKRILKGSFMDEYFLMIVATLGAFLLGKYAEAVEVFLLYRVGEMFEELAVSRSRRSIGEMMDISPDSANLIVEGEVRAVKPEEVQVGDLLLVRRGERVPLDSQVVTGSSSLNTAALTGESLPRDVGPGDPVLSGCINLGDALTLRAVKRYEESTVARMLELIEHAAARKAKTERFITRFARWYTPAVLALAALVAFLPPLLQMGTLREWLGRALIFLVVSCPCALVLSVPLSFFAGIGAAARQGILIKGGNYLEALARVETMVFDKTGTLTRGAFSVQAVHPKDCPPERLLMLAAYAESGSSHPIAESLRKAYALPIDIQSIEGWQEESGQGVIARMDGKQLICGSEAWLHRHGIEARRCHLPGNIVHLAMEGEYLGHVVIADEVKAEAPAAMRALREAGVRRLALLSGDSREVAEAVGEQLGLDEVHAGLLPQHKVAALEEMLAQQGGRRRLAYVGDGINDAPVLSRADLGIAMGAIGSDAAIEAADIVLMDDRLNRLPEAMGLARRTMGIVRQNIAFSIGIKLLILLLSALGHGDMRLAVFGDVGVAVLAVLNAMRAMKQ